MVNNNMSKSEGFPGDPFDGLLGYHVRRLSVVVMADLAASLAPLGLKPAAASVLFAIAAGEGLTQSDVGRKLGIKRANMAPLIAVLVRQGLVERDARDGRSQLLRLSEAGTALEREAMLRVVAHEDRMFGALSDEVRGVLLERVRGLWPGRDTGVEVD